LTTLREARDFVSHYLPTARQATQLRLEIALKLLIDGFTTLSRSAGNSSQKGGGNTRETVDASQSQQSRQHLIGQVAANLEG
jgi:hypothetical protein